MANKAVMAARVDLAESTQLTVTATRAIARRTVVAARAKAMHFQSAEGIVVGNLKV